MDGTFRRAHHSLERAALAFSGWAGERFPFPVFLPGWAGERLASCLSRLASWGGRGSVSRFPFSFPGGWGPSRV